MIAQRASYVAVGAGSSALLTMLLITLDVSVILAAIVLGVQIALGMVGFWVIMTGDGFQPAARPQPAVKPPLQPPATASQPLEEIYLRLANRPQPPTTAPQPELQPPATAPQPERERITLPFPLANGHHHRVPQPRAEIPWQPAPWDALAGDAPSEPDDDPVEPAAAALLPRRPPTAADYIVIRQALADCDGSRRRACVLVYGSRDGQTYPWLRRVADYWEISDADRPGILAWELLGTRDIPGHLAQRLGIDLTDDDISAAIDAAHLTRCAECDAWCTLDETDENGACTRCTS